MQLLSDLGVNFTIWFHLAIFLFAYISLKAILFNPYSQALAVRNEQTKGGEALAQDLLRESEELQNQYEIKLRELNEQIDRIYKMKKKEGISKEDQIISSEKNAIQEKYVNFQKELKEFVTKSSKDLELESPKIANLITSKLLD